ncbi:MAG: lysophospholipid acyltransferase family protein, partial [Bacilli bacterium]
SYERLRGLTLFVFKKFHLHTEIEGAEFFNRKEPFVMYANHYSDLDPIILIALSEKPISFVAKKETLKFPFIGKVVRILEGVAIDRRDLRSQLTEIDKAVKMVESGRSLVIFPEGTRNRYPDRPLGEFKPGAFKIAYRTGAPIVPCALYGTFRPLNLKSKLKTYPIWIRFFSPILKDEYLQINTVDFAPRVQSMIQSEIDNVLRSKDDAFLADSTKKKN